MAKLYFYYSAMNAGKTTTLLQSNYNYHERGMKTLLFTPELDDRYQKGQITSRIGLKADAQTFAANTDLQACVQSLSAQDNIDCVLIDEAQFLTKTQVEQLVYIVDHLKIPVLAYGLRTDFRAEPFEGSQYLLAWADNLIEIKTVCHCGKKATHTLRVNETGDPILDGEQVATGGNEMYVSVCRKHFSHKQARSYT